MTQGRKGNYSLQAAAAKTRFLTYDQQALARKLDLQMDGQYLYATMLGTPYRISRKTGDVEYLQGDTWVDGNSFEEVMTILDMLCDGEDQRWFSGRWKNTQSFGRLFHQGRTEQDVPREAVLFDRQPELLRRGCLALGGREMTGADISYKIELFYGLTVWVQFWHGDEEFAPRLRYLWDERADRYIRYETMYYAIELMLRRIIAAQDG